MLLTVPYSAYDFAISCGLLRSSRLDAIDLTGNTAAGTDPVRDLSAATLASVLDQSIDCVKLIGLDGAVRQMNGNGLCAMEIDHIDDIRGKAWAELWPEDARQLILASYQTVTPNHPARFQAFCPTAKGTPRWWDVTISSVSDNSGQTSGFLSISRDITDTRAGREALEVVVAEMKHRLKNTYMMISGLLLGFARGDTHNELFARDMADRLQALSVAQSMFLADEAPCDIAVLIPALLAPFGNASCPVTISPLPHATLDQGQADAIALVLGELSVNSAKHGAFHKGGQVDLKCNATQKDLSIEWVERSDAMVVNHARDGSQGMRLMERIVHARRGTFTVDWYGSGLKVCLGFSLKT